MRSERVASLNMRQRGLTKECLYLETVRQFQLAGRVVEEVVKLDGYT
jgi:hypothetical protein